jgi:hypothetical protein
MSARLVDSCWELVYEAVTSIEYGPALLDLWYDKDVGYVCEVTASGCSRAICGQSYLPKQPVYFVAGWRRRAHDIAKLLAVQSAIDVAIGEGILRPWGYRQQSGAQQCR